MAYCKRNSNTLDNVIRPRLKRLAYWNLNQIARYYGISTKTLIDEIDRCKDSAKPFPKPSYWIGGKPRFLKETIMTWMESPAKYVKIGGKKAEMGDVDKGDG